MPRPDDAAGRTLTELMHAAAGGDEVAWNELYRRVKDVAWKVINGYRLSSVDADDAFAAVMLRLAENLERIRDPERLPGWMATTARNEVMSMFRVRAHSTPFDPADLDGATGGDHERGVVVDELQQAIRAGLARLSERCQQLLRMRTADQPVPYDQIGEIFGYPHGSISKRLRDCLAELRQTPELQPYVAERRP